MSDRNERACANCGSLIHHENECEGAGTRLANLLDALADSALTLSDEQILSEAKEAGIDVDAEAARVRGILLKKVQEFKRRKSKISGGVKWLKKDPTDAEE